MCSMVAVAVLLPALVAGDNSVWTANPFKWDTVGDKLYTFCCNQTGNYSETGLSRIAQTKMMVHGMEEQAMNAPVWQNSEAKVRDAHNRSRHRHHCCCRTLCHALDCQWCVT